MAKWVCNVCGYVHEGETAPEVCPICKAPADKFTKQDSEMTWAAEHVVGVAQGVSEDILADLRANFEGECSEVGMYLAMARVAHREGYPEIGLYWEKAAYEEAEHASKFAELLGEVVTDSTKKNLEMRVAAENGATAGKFDLAKRAKAANLDAIHDTVHEMARDEARHGKAFQGLLERYFGKIIIIQAINDIQKPCTYLIQPDMCKAFLFNFSSSLPKQSLRLLLMQKSEAAMYVSKEFHLLFLPHSFLLKKLLQKNYLTEEFRNFPPA